MIELNLQKDSGLQFNLSIDGADKPITEVRFTVQKDADMKVSFAGKIVEGVCSVDMRNANLFLTNGDYPCFLEVLIDQNLFTPISETLHVVKPTKVSSTIIPAMESAQSHIQVSAMTQIAAESIPQPVIVTKIVEDAKPVEVVTAPVSFGKLARLNAMMGR